MEKPTIHTYQSIAHFQEGIPTIQSKQTFPTVHSMSYVTASNINPGSLYKTI